MVLKTQKYGTDIFLHYQNDLPEELAEAII